MTEAADLEQRWAALNAEPELRRLSPLTLRAAWWAFRAVRRARRDLRSNGLKATVGPPPSLPWGSRGGVNGVLRRTSPTCLERCLVLQSWLSSHGISREVVIGVANNEHDQGLRAHAWVDGMTHPAEFDGFQVIHRIAP